MNALSPEDSLRLHVLIAQAEAVRIDENQMAVFGLMGEREMRVDLNPTLRADQYLTQVRELFAAAVLDSPGGYPVFLRRWTRMGQIESDQLDRLLRLGEPEAVMAVVCAQGLTDDLARKAWWIAPYSEHARRMLERPAVVQGSMGRQLAEHLIDHLPFESEHQDMLDTVRLVLQPGLIDAEQRLKLWQRGKTKSTYRVGFLLAEPNSLPEPVAPRSDWEAVQLALAPLLQSSDPLAQSLVQILSSAGQSFCSTVVEAMKRPADQEVISALFGAVGRYFSPLRQQPQPLRTVAEIDAAATEAAQQLSTLPLLRTLQPQLTAEVEALLWLAHFDETVVLPIFSVSDSIGSVMRNKIAPISEPLLQRLAILTGRNKSDSATD